MLTDNKPLPEALPAPLADKALLLAGIAFLIVLIFTVTRSVASFRRYLLQKLGQETVFDMREALYAKVHALGLDYHGKKRTGDTITRVTSDVKEVRTMLVDSVVEVFSSVMILIGMLVVMLWLDWQLTLLALVTVPFLFLAVSRYRQVARAADAHSQDEGGRHRQRHAGGHNRHKGRQALRPRGRRDGALQDGEQGVPRGQRGQRDDRGEVQHRARDRRGPRHGAGRVLRGEAGPRPAPSPWATLRSSWPTSPCSSRPLWALSRQVNQIGTSLVSGERIIELLNAEPTVKDLPGARPAPAFDGRVTFEDVRFAYEDEAGEVLRGMDFDVEAGSRVALVGVSGAGKTTVTSLIARLYDPQEGRVLIDGEDVKDFTLKSLRDSITFVPQDPLLFRATVAENIAYGRPGASREEIEAVAELAGADEFIRELPEGYDTVLSERGESLSGGQRQRISIARAMLRDTPILILDEPQSGLDAEAAAAVEESWRALTEGRTTFVIAHELRLVRSVDPILVIEDGRVAETGTHEDLVSSGRPLREALLPARARPGPAVEEVKP